MENKILVGVIVGLLGALFGGGIGWRIADAMYGPEDLLRLGPKEFRELKDVGYLVGMIAGGLLGIILGMFLGSKVIPRKKTPASRRKIHQTSVPCHRLRIWESLS
jgi:uncharacterized membrane protein YfcA